MQGVVCVSLQPHGASLAMNIFKAAARVIMSRIKGWNGLQACVCWLWGVMAP